ncbi:MAG: YicC family protein [Clostridiales bacterium]|nr:YicC family protein [Clostridiales bacterium]
MRSMTGCGRCQMLREDWEITVELKAVNHRFLDISCRLPRSIAFLEETVRQSISAQMKRGHVDVFITVRRVGDSNRQVQVDAALAKSYMDAAQAVAAAIGKASLPAVTDVMRMEGVVTLTEADMDDEAVTALCREAADGAVSQLCDMRDKEGVNLRADLSAHLEAAAALREKILLRAPGVVEDYRTRLQQKLSQMINDAVEPQRLAQEVAIMADRCAIDEELSRLDSHIGQMRKFFGAKGEIGKKMDFLIQEMNREANTIGSKASDAQIAQYVVDLKSEIEKMREQVQNVE